MSVTHKETHEREKQFQLAKRQVRYIEAIEEGAIPINMVSAADIEVLEAYQSDERRRNREYENRHKNLAGRMAPPSFPNFAGNVFYTDNPTNLVYKVCKKLKMTADENFAKATVHVVKDRRGRWTTNLLSKFKI